MRKLFLGLLFLTAACNLGGNEVRPMYPTFLPAPPQGGPQEFQQGWRDGCDTGLAAHGTDAYRIKSFPFKQNPDLIMNPNYYKGWKDAENYCRTYIFEYLARNMSVYCSVDGLQNDCEDDGKASVPFLGGQGEKIGQGVFGNAGEDSLFGGGTSDDKFLGATGGVGSVMGNW